MAEEPEQPIRWVWTIYDFKAYITPGFVWFDVIHTDSVPLYVPWDPNPYTYAILPLVLNYTTKRPFTRQGYGWLRGVWTACRLVWVFRPSRFIYRIWRDGHTRSQFVIPISQIGNQFWFRFRVTGSVSWMNTSTPIFQLIIPTCPPPGGSGLSLIVGPPPPPIGDGFADITLTFAVYDV